MARLTKQEILDVRAVVFGMETVCHLNPTRMDSGTVRAYLEVCNRIRTTILSEEPVEAEEKTEVSDGQS